MLRLYDNHLSGNGYKPRLLLAHLGRTYEHIEVDILKGETRTPEFLAKNPNGRVPVLELEDAGQIFVLLRVASERSMARDGCSS